MRHAFHLPLAALTCVLTLSLLAGCGGTSAPGKLTCPAGSTACGGHCVDTKTDQANCGVCGKACAAGEVCAAGTCAVSCPKGEVECSGKCIDPNTDRAYCGASADCTGANAGTACPAGQLCTGGACAANCPSGEIVCGGTCVDPKSNRAYCGASADCTGTHAGTACAAGQVCNTGACALSCPAGTVKCGTSCIDPNTDDTYCGASGDCTGSNAGTTCAGGQVCVSGACATSCPTGEIDCGGKCIDPNTDGTYCGASTDCTGSNAGTTCAPGQVCVSGACATSCPSNEIDCGGTCIDPNTDGTYCGASTDCTGSNAGTTCAPGQACVSGACVTSCPSNEIDCGGTCIDPTTDMTHCGASGDCTGTNAGTACASGQVCGGGVCTASCGSAFATCPATAAAGPYCADTQTDPSNCGTCGNACTPKNAAGPACAGGNCGYTTCSAGYGDCNGNTADGCETHTATDVNNCGACGVVCSPLNAAGATCTAGACGYTSCNTGYGDCDGSTANGCESNLMTDVFNCGACGTVCQGGEVCANGTCTYAPTPMASLISMGGDGTSITLSEPRNVQFTLAAPAPATIYYTTDGSTPKKGAAGTTAATAPVSLPAMGTTTIKWVADYGSAAEASIHTMTYTVGTSHQFSWIGENLDFSPTGGGASGPIITATPGEALSATVNWQAWSSDSQGYCPGCVVQFALGVDSLGQLFCHNNLTPYPGSKGTATLTFKAPTTPGVYYVRGGQGLNYTCAQTGYSSKWTELGEVIVP